MGVELKPCPFCGGTAHVEQPGTRRQSCVVECDSCGIRHESGDEGSMCGTAWNRREGEAARIQQQAARIAELEKERDALKVDAKRFRRLESDGVLHDIAPVIRWQTVMRFEPAKSLLNCRWTSEMKAVYVEQPIREIKLRWVDENNDQPTLLHMIDTALQGEKETRS